MQERTAGKGWRTHRGVSTMWHSLVAGAESRGRAVTVPILSLMVQPHRAFWALTVLFVMMVKAVTYWALPAAQAPFPAISQVLIVLSVDSLV